LTHTHTHTEGTQLIVWLWFVIGGSHVSDRFAPPSCQ